MFGLYITHPQVQIDPAVPVPDWGLSALGRARADACVTRPWVRELSRIVSSGERKAIETAEILASATGVDVEIHPEMHENDRSATGFLAPMQLKALRAQTEPAYQRALAEEAKPAPAKTRTAREPAEPQPRTRGGVAYERDPVIRRDLERERAGQGGRTG